MRRLFGQCPDGMATCQDGVSCGTNTNTDPSNCGKCGNPCASQTCSGGTCACSADGSVPACPNGTCPNPDNQSDPLHCGDSCIDCTTTTGSSTSQCSGGACVCSARMG